MVFQIRSQDAALVQINQQAVQLAELRPIRFPNTLVAPAPAPKKAFEFLKMEVA